MSRLTRGPEVSVPVGVLADALGPGTHLDPGEVPDPLDFATSALESLAEELEVVLETFDETAQSDAVANTIRRIAERARAAQHVAGCVLPRAAAHAAKGGKR